MRILYCDSGFSPKEIEYMYADEHKACKELSLASSLISYEALAKANVEFSIKRVRSSDEKELGIYRGWMLKPIEYEALYNGLLKKKIQLINTPKEYKFCHYLPESYDFIKSFTPKTTFKALKTKFNIADFNEEINTFGNSPIIIKDYVKSQKHYWKEACFIPDASDKENVLSVINKFLELQGADLNEGLVFREFVELEKLTNHSKSGMPLTKEFRIFVLNGSIIETYKYWDEGDYENVEPCLDAFQPLIPKIKSKFFTMDIAKQTNGN